MPCTRSCQVAPRTKAHRDDTVAMPRTEAGHHARPQPFTPRRRTLHPKQGVPDPLGSLTTSISTSTRTAANRVHDPTVGELTLTYEMMELSADPGLTLAVYTAEPGSRSEEGLNLLASWAATVDDAEPART